jgi:hypothetical protein
MKKILFTLLFLFAFFAGYSQMSNNGGVVTVETGATLVIEGSYTSTSSGVIRIDGAVQLKGDFINNSGTVHASSIGTLTLNGTAAQNIGGTAPTNFYCALEVNNANGVSLNGANEVLSSALTLTNGKLTLNAYDLTLAAVGVTGASSSKYVVTNSTGQLKAAVGATNYIFPVGTTTSYNPLILNEAGTADTYGVIFTGALPGGWTGGLPHTVLGNWTVTEGTPGGNNLTATPQWNGTQEQASFARTDCAVGVSTDNGATVAWKASGAAAGGDPYTKSGAGFASVGKFMVGDYFFEGIDLDLDVMLAGPYSGGSMSTALNSIIPLTDPYSLGTTVGSIPATAVDWIKVELRDKTNHATTLFSRAYFVDATGNVLNTDGTSGAKLKGIAKDQYYIAVSHRNHFGVVSSSTVDLTSAAPAYNFSTAQSQAWQDGSITTNAAMKLVGTGVYGLWDGDANGDGVVNYLGGTTDRSSIVSQLGATSLGTTISGYYNNDLNMNGSVAYLGGTSDRSVIVNNLGATALGTSISRHLP